MHPFPYDPFQTEAIESIKKGQSVFVSAPTGSGKTVIAEVAVEEAFASGGMAIYTAPVKALSNQKFRDFHAQYGDRVGILTGDLTLNPEAPLLIMTTEIYRNALLEGKTHFSACRWVIFDEVHFLDDSERGTVWEESLLLTPRKTEILALSATIPNAQELATWIEKIHGRPVQVIQESHRPVPLKTEFQCQDKLYPNTETTRRKGYEGKDRWKRSQSMQRPIRNRRHRGRPHTAWAPTPRGRSNRADHLMMQIQKADHLPCLYFTFSRKRTETLAWEFAALDLADAQTKSKLLREFDRLCERYELTHEKSALVMRELVAQGVAYHHAGLLPTLKEVVEILFSSRLIKAIATTETFALGINMPARSVVLDTLTKRTDRGRRMLRVRELSQMVGRAGRRGMDEAGFAYLRVNPWEVDFPSLLELVEGKPEQVMSRFSTTYATLLNLYRNHGEDLLPFYLKTFHAFQHPPSRHKQLFASVERKLNLLKELGYVEGVKAGRGLLTSKGEFASTLYGYELLLSELFEVGTLDTLTIADLGVLLLAMVHEPRRGIRPPKPPRRLKDLMETSAEVLEKIHDLEQQLQITSLSKKPAFQLAGALERWLVGGDFDQVVTMARADEGELVRYFRMTLQLARTLSKAPAATKSLKQKAHVLMNKINRDPVDAEAELRRSL